MDPTQNPAGNDPAPTTTDTDDSEWDDVGLDFLADKGQESDKKEEEQRTIDEQAESKKDDKEEGAPKSDPENQKPNEEQKPGDEANKATGEEGKPAEAKTPEPAPNPDAEDRARRRAQLDLEADRKELAQDIKAKMYSDVPDKLLDAEGKEIRTPQDVTQYRNPATGQNFSLEEATRWLQLAQLNLEDKSKTTQGEIDNIVDVNIRVKEEADEILEEFGALLRDKPGLRKQIWEDYKATLQVSADGEVIVGAPVSMRNFYRTQLTPYKVYAEQQQTQAEQQAEVDQKAKDEAAKKKAATEKRQSQSDREDVFSTRTKTHEGMDPEEKEWAEVGKEYYEG